MKELKPLIRTQFKCDFCNHIYVRKTQCANHEKECYKNPNRICNTCKNTGIEFFYSLDSNSKDIFKMVLKTETRPCNACKIAEEAGGKSYLKKG